jgi:hypothetical protein
MRNGETIKAVCTAFGRLDTEMQNQHMQPGPVMASLFHAVRQWRGAADVQR